jgi:hypothetical protein
LLTAHSWSRLSDTGEALSARNEVIIRSSLFHSLLSLLYPNRFDNLLNTAATTK